jgi:hypothetical protein
MSFVRDCQLAVPPPSAWHPRMTLFEENAALLATWMQRYYFPNPSFN